jgi:hypothetical protein
MQNYIIAQTNKTPKVTMDAHKGRIELKGSSIIENSRAFFEPIIAWIYEYVKTPKNTKVHIELEYFNSSSAKAIISIFRALSKVKKEGFELKVDWYYSKEDDDMKECGENYASLIDADFKLVEKP